MTSVTIIAYCTMVMTMTCAQQEHATARGFVDELLREAAKKEMLLDSNVLDKRKLAERDIGRVLAEIGKHPDYKAYHVLFALRRDRPKEYGQVPSDAKAAILCSAMANVSCLNDWGSLSPEEGSDGIAGSALRELGKAAVKRLRPLLDDKRRAPLFGNEDATENELNGYRRADFAFRYACLILGRKPKFDRDPKKRDAAIVELKKSLDR